MNTNTKTRTYYVTVVSKYPSAGEMAGTLEIDAQNAKKAISAARQETWRRGHLRCDGPLLYFAKRKETSCPEIQN